jgi:NAD(P)-dependent dehydrogenase (short-subunit alcohol dehydrogenase family)
MDYQLAGKTAFVAAGAHGIGEAIANLLTEEGARVIVADLEAEVLKEKAGQWHGTIAGDLSTAEGVDRCVSHALKSFGDAPDVLINNLGVGNPYNLEEQTDEGWAKSFQVNLMGTVRICRAIVPRMAARGSGSVVNTGSDLAKQPEPAFLDYGSCKSALLYLTKAMAKQYAPKVRVNTVLPGPIWSRMWTRPGGILEQIVQQYGLDPDASVKKFLEERQMPMGIGQPEDVAHAVVFLASPRAKFITGAGLDIGGTIRGLI